MNSGSSDSLTTQTLSKLTQTQSHRIDSLFKYGITQFPLLEDEIKNAKGDSRVVRVENILEQYPSNHDEEVLLNPCFGTQKCVES